MSLLILQGSKRKNVRALLHVSGDGLKVVDDDTKGLIVDQTIEKVSFCAPDRNYERGFSYICRDGTTRRWMCHGFIAIKESVSQPFNYFETKYIFYIDLLESLCLHLPRVLLCSRVKD